MEATVQGVVKVIRTLHIYLTMLALILFLFFGVTGFMLNHPEWFGLEDVRTRTTQGVLPQRMVDGVDKLAIVETLRAEFGAAGALESFEIEPEHLRITFKRPGHRTEATVVRRDGRLETTTESRGTAAVLTDLHMGHGAGRAWRALMDGASLLLLAASVTGLTLWISLPRRRRVGIAALAVGVIASALAYLLFVP